jgi:predicted secreted hydrolase
LQSTSGKEFGFELTFFRSGVPLADGVKHGPWVLKNIYMTHLALSDVAGKTFYHDEKICRAGVGSAGAEANTYKVWTENWSVNRDNGQHHLVAKDKDFGIDLQLDEGKSPAIHGENGVSQKASCVGCASHYYSFTRMPASGKVSVRGETIPVKGIAWMDHEFGSNQLTADQVGWDWYSIQLDDNTELMLYVMRLKNGKYDTNSSGTYILADGKTEHLPLKDYKVSSTGTWVSPHTGGKYPSRWHVSVPSKRIELNIEPLLDDQELLSRRGGISYWEGTCKVSGSKDAKSVSGKAYVELTGYSRELNKNI